MYMYIYMYVCIYIYIYIFILFQILIYLWSFHDLIFRLERGIFIHFLKTGFFLMSKFLCCSLFALPSLEYRVL